MFIAPLPFKISVCEIYSLIFLFKLLSYVCVIKRFPMNKSEIFEDDLQDLARFAKVISHPARLAILKFLAETKTCISGDISDYLPLSRTTVSQHLKELRSLGLIHGEIDGLKINYCLCQTSIKNFVQLFDLFFEPIVSNSMYCNTVECIIEKNDTEIVSSEKID